MATTGINPYTAYQLFPGSQFQEANKAAAPAYTGTPYQCPFSQRAPAWMFTDFVQKQHYDAANTGCCQEPVTPYYTRPQYQDVSTPTETRDCVEEVPKLSCGAVQVNVSYFGAQSICAAYKFPNFDVDVRCPLDCPGIDTIKQIGVKAGQHGRFIYVGEKTAVDWVVRYEPDDALVQTAWDTCGGTASYTESVCVGKSIAFDIKANLDNTGGCYCDCCGDNGRFDPPTHVWTTPDMTATWENTLDLSGNIVKLDTACKDGLLTATVYVPAGLGSDYSLPWSITPAYSVNNISKVHKWQGTPGTLGSSGQPACCGATVRYIGDDGCAYSGYQDEALARKPGTPAWSPSSATLYTGTAYTIKITDVCNKSGLVELTLTPTGINTSGWGTVNTSVNGEISRSLGTATLTNTFAYKGCCGNGSIATHGNDGCANTSDVTYYMRNTETPGAVGHSLRCSVDHVVKRGDLSYVSEGQWLIENEISVSGTYPSMAACLATINTTGGSHVISTCALGSCANCCYHFWITLGSGYAFLFCLDDTDWSTSPTCIPPPTNIVSQGWVNANSSTCCPN